jgi:hypothetical protein
LTVTTTKYIGVITHAAIQGIIACFGVKNIVPVPASQIIVADCSVSAKRTASFFIPQQVS